MNREQGTMSKALGAGRRALSEEVPTGYKRTEVGVIPEDWDIMALRNIIEKFVNGGTPSTKNAAFWSGNIPWITGADILNQTVVVIRRHITEEAVHNSSTSVIAKGNLLIVSRTGVGKLAIAPCDIAISQDFTGVIPNKEKILAKYLFRHFDFCQHVLAKQNQGTSIKGITRDTLAAILIPLPPLSEQRAIAEALADVDGLLAALEALITKKRAVKQAAMQQLLTGKTRLPGFSGAWETRRLGEIAPLQRGFDLPTSQIRLGSYAVVYSNGVLQHHERAMAKGPGVVTGRSGTIGKVHFIEKDYWPHNTALWVTSFRENDPKFIYYLYTHINLVQFLSGSGVPTLNRNDVHQHLVACPSPSEQRAIAAVLSDMDKQGMMQQLLTGRVRLVEPKTITEGLAATRPAEQEAQRKVVETKDE